MNVCPYTSVTLKGVTIVCRETFVPIQLQLRLMCFVTVHMTALHLPEENRCLDILELIEHTDLLR